jgi:hypothetical protein
MRIVDVETNGSLAASEVAIERGLILQVWARYP